MLLTVMLLNSFMSLLAATDDNSPSTGEDLKTDTVKVTIPINLIKKANAKMIERNYLFDINNQKDSIIIMKDKYIREQYNIITDFQKRISDTNKLNEDIKSNLEKQKRKTKYIGYGAGSIIIGIIIGLICK